MGCLASMSARGACGLPLAVGDLVIEFSGELDDVGAALV